jgi:hypothetical protein
MHEAGLQSSTTGFQWSQEARDDLVKQWTHEFIYFRTRTARFALQLKISPRTIREAFLLRIGPSDVLWDIPIICRNMKTKIPVWRL